MKEKASSVPAFIQFDNAGKFCVSPPLLAEHIRKTEKYFFVQDRGKRKVHIFVYHNGCYCEVSEQEFRGIIKQPILRCKQELLKMSDVNEVFWNLKSDLSYVAQKALNADESVINFRNGLLHISATEAILQPHTPAILSSIQIPCNWSGTEVATPVFDAYMQMLTNGDDAVKELLLECIGVSISNLKCWRMRKVLFLVGEKATGKSVLKALVERILGEGNYIGIELNQLTALFGTSAIYQTRLAGSSDMKPMQAKDMEILKKLTGGDNLSSQFKHEQVFDFTYDGFLWFCMRKAPVFTPEDQSIYERIMLINCPNSIPEEQQDRLLLDKLIEERDGIVYKAVKAAQNVIANGFRFSEPDSVRSVREEYLQRENSVLAFYRTCMCERTQSRNADEPTVRRIYKAYCMWCGSRADVRSPKEFQQDLAAHLGCQAKDLSLHTNRGEIFRRLTLTAEAKKKFESCLQ